MGLNVVAVMLWAACGVAAWLLSIAEEAERDSRARVKFNYWTDLTTYIAALVYVLLGPIAFVVNALANRAVHGRWGA